MIDTLGAAPASTTPRPADEDTDTGHHARRPGIKTAAVLTMMVAFGLTVWALRDPGTQPSAVPDSATTAHPPTSTSATAADGCGADPGDQNSSEAVIQAFEYAYYVARSGERARALATPTSSVQPAEALQAVIDAIPPATTYCLHTTAITGDVFLAVLSEKRPDQPPQQWTQTITTKQIDGRWYVDVFK
ncbi:hypothetical protein [Nocardia pseudovaccinii]|uniref:hypothetical protein n=1 Tax=Nocardia pseudovaccinii TaxID=189540 RepID=UPI0007A45947|nr:hypothetical protein [Nocardia pseudovaccinii]